MAEPRCRLRIWGPGVIAGVVGAGIGVAYALTIGCTTGGCPITSNPWLSGLFGAAIGVTLVHDPEKARRKCRGDAGEEAREMEEASR